MPVNSEKERGESMRRWRTKAWPAVLMVAVLAGTVFAGTVLTGMALASGLDAGVAKAASVLDRIAIQETLEKLKKRYGLKPGATVIVVRTEVQKLHLVRDGRILRSFTISTSKYGIGGQRLSKRTPPGTHRVKRKIGLGLKIGTLLRSGISMRRRVPIYKNRTVVKEDQITTRILWLDGQERRINRGPQVDSFSRYIYIHGTPEEGWLGTPRSKGCIRMANKDVVWLFDRVPTGTLVEIQTRERPSPALTVIARAFRMASSDGLGIKAGALLLASVTGMPRVNLLSRVLALIL